jgi:hypothetical protein
VLQSYVPVFDKCIRQSVESLRQRCDKGEFDIKHDVMLVVMNAVLSESNFLPFLLAFPTASSKPSTVSIDTTFGKEISPEIAEGIMTSTEKYVLTIIVQFSIRYVESTSSSKRHSRSRVGSGWEHST